MSEKQLDQAASVADHSNGANGDARVSHPPPPWLADSVSIAPKVRYDRRYKPEAGEAFTGVVVDRGEEDDPYGGDAHRVVVIETADRIRHGVRILADLRSLWWVPDRTPVFIRALRKRPLHDGKFAWEFDLRVPTGTKFNTERGAK